jgi:cytoskeletal protein CcmA (bactofilin family)
MTSIGSSVIINGELSSDEDLRIDGHVNGQVHLREDATLTIGETARVQADLRGSRILVLGTVQGNITASERIELGPSSTVTGDVSANRVVLIEGASFQGRIDMDKRTIATKVAQFRAAAAT